VVYPGRVYALSPLPPLGHIRAPSAAVSMAGMMRISLHARTSLSLSQPCTSNVPLSVLIRPANHVEGSFEYQTDQKSLLKLLREKTDLSGYVLDTFRRDLEQSAQGRLEAVKVRDEVLKKIGYFID